MANTTTSPNMGMPVPVVSTCPGPDWATDVNADLSIIDGHNHSAGSGVQITPAGININADLSFANNNAVSLRSVRFTSQGAVLTVATDLGCLYEVLGDLYYNDGSGNNIRITQSGSVSGAAGTITGLPSGTASASYSAGTFTFLGATSTPATMAVGPLIVGNATASSKTVTIAPNAGIAANYNFTLPAAVPAALNYMTLDNSGNVSFNASGVTGSGAVVLAVAPTFSGVPTGTITGGSFSPTVAFTHLSGGTASFSVTTNNSYYHRIGNVVTLESTIIATISAFTSSCLYNPSITIPLATTTLLLAGGIGVIDNPTSRHTVLGLDTVSNTGITFSPTSVLNQIDTNGTFQFSIHASYLVN